MKIKKHTLNTSYKPLNYNDLGEGYRFCRNIFIHI